MNGLKKVRDKKFVLVVAVYLLIILGFLFRLKIATLFPFPFPHEPIADEKSYTYDIPNAISSRFFFADCCARSYIYPFFVFLIYKLFGFYNLSAIIVAQAVLDTLTAIILYFSFIKLSGDRKWAFFIFLFYLFNPLTSAYTGLFVSEILAISLLVLSFYMFIRTKTFKSMFLAGLFLGMFAFTRTILFWWTLIFLICVSILMIIKTKRGLFLALTCWLGFLLTAIYPVYSNMKYFNIPSPVPVIPVSLRIFAEAINIHKFPGILEEYNSQVPNKLIYMSIENYSDPALFRKTITPELIKAKNYIFGNPSSYFFSRVYHFLNYWDKSNLYAYYDPFLPVSRPLLRVGNIIFLSTSLIGIVSILKKKKKNSGEIILLLLICLLIFYFVFPMSLFIPEERYTLPAYPLLLLFFPFGLNFIYHKFMLVRTLLPKLIFFLVFFLLIVIFIPEMITRKVSPQMTFSEAMKYSINCMINDYLLPISLPKNHSCRMLHYRGDYDVTANMNSLGYRNKEFSQQKNEGIARILAVGDSFTFGIGVSDENTYPAQLDAILKSKGKNTEVINAGYASGFSPDAYYLYLKERGLKLNPDIVIVGFFVLNDITDLSETVWEKTDDRGLPLKIGSCCRTADGGVYHNKKIAFKYRYPVLRNSHLFQLLINAFSKTGLFKEPDLLITKRDRNDLAGCIFSPGCIQNFKEEEEKTYKVLKELKNILDEKNIPLLVVLIPPDFQLYPEVSGKYQNKWDPPKDDVEFLQKRIAERFKEIGIDHLDLYSILDTQRQRGYPYYPFDAHFNNLGHQITTEAISDYLVNKGLLK